MAPISIWHLLRGTLTSASLLAAQAAFALDASDFSDLEGWTVSAVTSVDGEFEGCDFDRKIRFTNGWKLTCSEYSYNYAYSPEAVIFTKLVELNGKSFWLVRVLVDDEFYEMLSVPAKSAQPGAVDKPSSNPQRSAPPEPPKTNGIHLDPYGQDRKCSTLKDCGPGEFCVVERGESTGVCRK